MDLKLTRPGRKKVQVDDEVYMVKIPTLGDQKALQKDLESLDKNSADATEKMVSWLDSLGFPRNVAESLDVDSITQVIEAISKKKN